MNTATDLRPKRLEKATWPPCKKILAAVDLAGHPGPTLDYAVDLAERWDANLYLLHVHAPPLSAPYARGPQAFKGVQWFRHRDHDRLWAWADRIRARHRRTYALLLTADRLADQIIKTIQALKADYIAVGTHKHGGVAGAVVRKAEIPVWVAGAGVHPAPLALKEAAGSSDDVED